MNTVAYSLLIVFSAFIASISQVMLKKAADRTYPSRIKEYLNPLVFFAYVLFVVSAVMTMYAYKGVSISYGVLLESTGYIFVFLLDWLYLRGSINVKKVIAVVLILVGIVIATGQ